MDPIAAQRALQDIAASMLREAPASFVRLRASCRAAGTVGTYDFWLTDASGQERRWEMSPGSGFVLGLLDLRRATYGDGRGAFYTVNITVTPDGQFAAEYDYDNEPALMDWVVPDTWVEDLERFPRDEEHRPQWLKDKLAAAGR